MTEKLTCPNGHEWEADGVAIPCPVCGSVAESLYEGESSTWDTGTGDELPPPPGASSVTLMTEGPDVLPTVPGYEIVGELGRGGMGVVYEARHRALNRRVALKVIRGFAGRDEIARFRAEAEAVARLQHPSIVQIYEVGDHAGLPYLALEFVDGGSLAAHLRSTALTPRAAAELGTALARAVQHAHSRGVIHRDLKPANILLAADGTPKVGDFGLAKLGDDPGRSRSGLIIGTPAYMAPEQASGRGDLVGPPADVWALGVILYECLTRRPPFLGANSAETVHQVLTTEPVAPARVAGGVPRDLDTICLKCLRKEPDQRYRTAGDLADDITRFLEGRPILARRVPWWEKLGKWAHRRPAAAGLIVVTFAAAAALAGIGYRYFRDLEDRNTTISRNVLELEERNATITQKSHALELANAATIAERDRAEENLVGALEAVDGLLSSMGLVHVAHIPHIDKTREKLLNEALRVCDRLLALQKENPRLRMLQAATLQRAGHILSLLQRYKEAEEKLDQALAGLAQVRAAPGRFAPKELLKVESLTRMSRGSLYLQTGQPGRAAEEQESALELLSEVWKKDPDDFDLRFLAAIGNANAGMAALEARDNEKASLHLGRARQLAEDLVRARPEMSGYAGVLALALNGLGAVHSRENELERAEELFAGAIAIGRRLVLAFPGDVDYRQALARALSNRGNALRARGYLKQAAEPLAEALAILEKLANDHDDIGSLHVELSWSYYHTGLLHHSRNDYRAADEWLTKALNRLAAKPALLRADAQARYIAGVIHELRGAVREQLKLFPDAVSDLAKAGEYAAAGERVRLRIEKAKLLLSAGQSDQALEELVAALAGPDDVSAADHFAAGVVFARAANAADKRVRAEELARRAVRELTIASDGDYFRDRKRRTLLDDHLEFKHLRDRADFNELRGRVRRP
jgi:tetratricopeptide (TPR) repeat protein